MAGMISVRWDVRDRDRLEGVLDIGRLVGSDYRVGMLEMGRRLHDFLSRRTPIKTGHLRGGIAVEVDSRPVPRYAAVESTALSASGVDYGAILDVSSRTHYRAGPLTGQPTAGWFSKGVPEAQRLVDAFLGRVAHAIERNFAAGVR